jgi:uncharacterized protein (DUF433 family)
MSGRVIELEVQGSEGNVLVTGNPIWFTMGGLRSSLFTIRYKLDSYGNVRYFVFRGAGYGHGMGMDQHAAAAMAGAGMSAEELLSHFYPRASLRQLYAALPLDIRLMSERTRVAAAYARLNEPVTEEPIERFVIGDNYTVTENLRLRNDGNLSAQLIRLLIEGEQVTVLEIGNEQTIQGLTSNWVRVRLSDDTEGWCFGGFLY